MQLETDMYIQCETIEQAEQFIKEAYKQGYQWEGDDETVTRFNIFEQDTYYHIHEYWGSKRITYGNVNVCPLLAGWGNRLIKFTDL